MSACDAFFPDQSPALVGRAADWPSLSLTGTAVDTVSDDDPPYNRQVATHNGRCFRIDFRYRQATVR